jgi:threonine dehydrogenase-like Zn-dependent dehydrogenase
VDVGALVEPLAVAWHAVNCSKFKAGDSALVLGAGPIGLLIAKVLLARKASKVVVSEPAAARRALADKLGATLTVNPLSDNLHQEVIKLTDARGVDVVFDAAGIQSSLDASLQCVRPKGTIVNVAIWEKPATINMNIILKKEIYLTGMSLVSSHMLSVLSESLKHRWPTTMFILK